jgi:hypothetical protein
MTFRLSEMTRAARGDVEGHEVLKWVWLLMRHGGTSWRRPQKQKDLSTPRLSWERGCASPRLMAARPRTLSGVGI